MFAQIKTIFCCIPLAHHQTEVLEMTVKLSVCLVTIVASSV